MPDEMPAPPSLAVPPPADNMDQMMPTEMGPTADAGAVPPPMPPTPEAAPMGAETPMEAPVEANPDNMKGPKKELAQIAEDYVVPISEAAIKVWSEKSKGDHKEFKTYCENMAMGLYPTLVEQIKAGVPVKTLLDPYVMVAQQVLGDGTEPNWNDPKWAKALQGGMDPKTGRPVPMTLDEWRKYLMTDSGHGWEYTPEAHQRVNDFIEKMHDSFTSGGDL